jgi:hypothetical protein
MAPSCGRCNGQKSGSVLIGRSSAVALTRIAGRLPVLETNLQKRKGERELEEVLRVVVRSVESGKFTSEEFLRQFNKFIPATGLTDPGTVKLPTGTLLNWSSKSLVFTDHAMRNMEERRMMPGDIAASVFEGLSDGTATALKNPGRNDQYLISGRDKLKVAFTVKGDRVIVLTAFHAAR